MRTKVIEFTTSQGYQVYATLVYPEKYIYSGDKNYIGIKTSGNIPPVVKSKITIMNLPQTLSATSNGSEVWVDITNVANTDLLSTAVRPYIANVEMTMTVFGGGQDVYEDVTKTESVDFVRVIGKTLATRRHFSQTTIYAPDGVADYLSPTTGVGIIQGNSIDMSEGEIVGINADCEEYLMLETDRCMDVMKWPFGVDHIDAEVSYDADPYSTYSVRLIPFEYDEANGIAKYIINGDAEQIAEIEVDYMHDLLNADFSSCVNYMFRVYSNGSFQDIGRGILRKHPFYCSTPEIYFTQNNGIGYFTDNDQKDFWELAYLKFDAADGKQILGVRNMETGEIAEVGGSRPIVSDRGVYSLMSFLFNHSGYIATSDFQIKGKNMRWAIERFVRFYYEDEDTEIIDSVNNGTGTMSGFVQTFDLNGDFMKLLYYPSVHTKTKMLVAGYTSDGNFNPIDSANTHGGYVGGMLTFNMPNTAQNTDYTQAINVQGTIVQQAIQNPNIVVENGQIVLNIPTNDDTTILYPHLAQCDGYWKYPSGKCLPYSVSYLSTSARWNVVKQILVTGYSNFDGTYMGLYEYRKQNTANWHDGGLCCEDEGFNPLPIVGELGCEEELTKIKFLPMMGCGCGSAIVEYFNTDGQFCRLYGEIKSRKQSFTQYETIYSPLRSFQTIGGNHPYSNEPMIAKQAGVSEELTILFKDIERKAYLEDIFLSPFVAIDGKFAVITEKEYTDDLKNDYKDYVITFKILSA